MKRTVQEMHTDLDFLIDKVKSPRFLPEQRDRVLNMAQDRIIQDRYDNIRKSTGYSYQSLQRVRDELRPIVEEKVITTITGNNTFDLPLDYRHEVLLEVYLNMKKGVSTPIGHDEQGAVDDDPFGKPVNDFPRHIESTGRKVKVFFDFGFLNKVKIYYLKDPPAITSVSPTQDCILPGHLHDEILNLAASIINGTVESYDRYKVSEKESKES